MTERDELIQRMVADLDPDTRQALIDEITRQDAAQQQAIEAQQGELMAEYRKLIEGVPPGINGTDARVKAKIKIRQRAAAAGVPSPV